MTTNSAIAAAGVLAGLRGEDGREGGREEGGSTQEEMERQVEGMGLESQVEREGGREGGGAKKGKEGGRKR
jgi:hypothetical protein